MNLITDKWIPVIRQDSSEDRIAPHQIAETDNPVIEIVALRPDFQGAYYQLIIGLLQTCFSQEDDEDWLELFTDPPTVETLRNAFLSVSHAFELTNDNGPAFMQEFDPLDAKIEPIPISRLLMETPRQRTLDNNTDHFSKRGTVVHMCESCTAIALFTKQTNGAADGGGYRTGIRKGGPLTTLALPDDPSATLWQKIWSNVLTQEDCDPNYQELSDVMPWLAPTRLSESGQETQPNDVHQLQMFWGMPSRISLPGNHTGGKCSLCGGHSNQLFSSFTTKKHGVNYNGPWVHPLTPYKKDPKNKKAPYPMEGKLGRVGYKDWLGLNLIDSSNGYSAAKIVQRWQDRVNCFKEVADQGMRLWCFGYDMDSAKACCWYDNKIPMVQVDAEYKDVFTELARQLIVTARTVNELLTGKLSKIIGDTRPVSNVFWSETEGAFYQHLNALAALPSDTSILPADMAAQWVRLLEQTASNQFDFWAVKDDIRDRNTSTVFNNRKELLKKLKTHKTLKPLWQLAESIAEKYINVEKNTVNDYRKIKESDQGLIMGWHASLQENLGERAQLRRVADSNDSLLTPAFARFLKQMPGYWGVNTYQQGITLPDAAMVASVVARVKEHDPKHSFAISLAKPREKGGNSVMSELRFQRLQTSQDEQEFFEQICRAVDLLRGRVNIPSLANDILHWLHEFRDGPASNPQNRLAVRWATDYYASFTKK